MEDANTFPEWPLTAAVDVVASASVPPVPPMMEPFSWRDPMRLLRISPGINTRAADDIPTDVSFGPK